MKLLKTILILLIIVAVFGGVMFGLNFYTGPIIDANNAGAELAPLLAVMPEGAEFGGDALLYSSENASASSLTAVPANVLSVYKEKNGLGFVVRATATSGYTSSPLVTTIGVTADGKICGIQIDSYGDDAGNNWNEKILTDEYISTYIGNDSALADVELIANPTSEKASSVAYKNAVSAAMSVLISNNLIVAGVKSDAQILEENIADVAPGLTVLAEVEASGNIQKALKAENGTGFAYIMVEGEATYLAIVNANGACKVYGVEDSAEETVVDVTADHAALATEAKAHAAANQADYSEAFVAFVTNLTMMPTATDFVSVDFDTFNSVVYAASFTADGATYYGFYSRSIGWGGHAMDVYIIVDETGAIVKVDAKQFIFEEEYFVAFAGMPTDYKGGFVGQTSETWNDDIAVIATATMTSNAMKQATKDAFAAFNSIKGGEQ